MEEVTTRRALHYLATDPGPLTLDLYYPPDHHATAAPKPAVVIVLGYPDVGVPRPFGCQFREMGMMVSWCRLFAASGMVGVVYETRNPANDIHSVLAYLQKEGAALGIDANRIGLWASSGNAPVALSVLMDGKARCSVLLYAMTLDLDGATGVEKGARMYHFANPTAGRGVEDLPKDKPLFIARAGQDSIAGLNEALGSFIAAGLRCNVPLTLINHPSGQHGFDYLDDSDETRRIIRAALAFLQANLES
jgi:hypothetical protein